MSTELRKKSGFTLVEFSIVLLIVGLVVGAILVGQELIHASKIRSTTGLYYKYVAAANAFLTKYRYFPGDIPSPRVDAYGLATCYDSSDALIPGSDGKPVDGCNYDHLTTPGNGVVDRMSLEAGNFFQHLSSAGMIEGSYTRSGIVNTGNVEDTYAISPLGTMFFPDNIISSSGSYEIGPPGFVLGVSLQGYSVFGPVSDVFDRFSPYDSYWVDAKLDDGNPARGKLFVLQQYDVQTYDLIGTAFSTLVSGISSECCVGSSNCSSTSDNYDISREDNLCTIAVQW